MIADDLPGLPPLEAVAAGAGMTWRARRWSPCPACGERTRSREDTRGPVGQSRGRDGRERWRCYRCDAGGDVVALLAAVRWGSVPSRGDPRWPELVTELRARYGIPGAGRPGPFPGRVAPSTPAEPPAPAYPPAAEVAALWAACEPVTAAGLDVRAWLEVRRGLSVDALAALDLVRLMPRGPGPFPAWVPTLGRAELARRLYPLAVPLYDAAGELRSLRWRAVDAVREPDPDRPGALRWARPSGVEDVTAAGLRVRVGDDLRTWPKAAAARGGLAGLVLADPMGLALLRAGPGAEVAADGLRWSKTVILCEGEPDTWTRATAGRLLPAVRARIEATGETSAFLGVVSGSWPDTLAGRALADRIPDGARVILATHADTKGDAYADAIMRTLAGRRVRLERAAPRPTTDTGAHDGT